MISKYSRIASLCLLIVLKKSKKFYKSFGNKKKVIIFAIGNTNESETKVKKINTKNKRL